MPHINGCVIILTTFFIYSMLNGKSLYLVNVTPKGERIWPTKVSTSLTSGGEICRNVVKEMFVNVRWSATGDETSIQIKPHLYQANHWPMWNWKMCWAQTSDIKMHIYTVLLSLSLPLAAVKQQSFAFEFIVLSHSIYRLIQPTLPPPLILSSVEKNRCFLILLLR